MSAVVGPPVLPILRRVPHACGMRTVKDVSELLNLTPRQVYDRLADLSPIIPEHVTAGRNGRKLLSEQGFTVFRRLVSLEAEGMARSTALKLIASELGNGDGELGNVERKDGELVAELRRTITRLEGEVAFLRQLVNERVPALPSARPWWWPLRRRING